MISVTRLATALVIALSSPTAASECLSELVTVVGWSAKTFGPGNGVAGAETQITLGLRNHGDQDIVMIEGTAQFVDALGNLVSPFPLPLYPDIVIPANAPGNQTYVGHSGESRLVGIDKALVRPSVCITGAVLADGSVIRAGS